MSQFLQKIQDIINNSENNIIQRMRDIRFVIQRQNEKLLYREEDIFTPLEGMSSDMSPVNRFRYRAEALKARAFDQTQWVYTPSDAQVDLAIEFVCRSNDRTIYLKRSGHTKVLMWYLGIEQEEAEKMTDCSTRRYEHRKYKLDRVATLDDIAGLHYLDHSGSPNGVRELKVYSTAKESTYVAHEKSKYRKVEPSHWLCNTQTYRDYQDRLQNTLREAAEDSSGALRIEVTIDLNLVEEYAIVPSRQVLDEFITLNKGTIQ